MKHRSKLAFVGLAAACSALALAEPPKETKPAAGAHPAGQPEMQLPPGMTEADMAACMAAATPGEMHQFLASLAGTWEGKNTMWMTPAAEPLKSECVSVFSPMMDGRFMKCETSGEMPGMGPFTGYGFYGFDNVSGKFQCTWADNCGTGMMIGTGELSSDKTTLTWTLTYNCPILKKPVTMRQVETHTSKDSMKLVMFGPDPKTGKEYKLMEIQYTRKGGVASASTR